MEGLSVAVTITVEKRRFYPGEIVRGTVHVDLDAKVKARASEIAFTGMEKAQVQQGKSSVSENHYIVNDELKMPMDSDARICPNCGAELGQPE